MTSTITPAAATVERHGDLPLTARNATLGDLASILQAQHARKLDVVAPATAIRSRGGIWTIQGAEAQLDNDGVTSTDGSYRPTGVADEGLADRLSIPIKYLRRLRDERTDLYDANVNGLLHGKHRRSVTGDVVTVHEADARSFLVRAFRDDAGGVGVARAVLSDRYRIVDNLDVLTAALDGVRESGMDVDVAACDLTERRMYVKINAPSVRELAPDLLGDYRSPFTRQAGADLPVVFAGFVLSNSETGGGAFTITPRITFQVCNNGMTISKDALRNVHLGGKLDEGVIRWSDETQQRNLDLVRSQAADAVRTFLDVEYLRGVLNGIRETAGKPIEDAAATVKRVTTSLRLASVQDEILDHFIRGGSMTAGGVMNALTSYAQTVEDADRSAEIEASAMEALALAAR